MEVLAACHLHSTWSYDGSWPLEALKHRFGSHGYQVLMMTEHDRGFTPSRHSEFREACAQASSDGVLVMPGIEYSDAANRVHVLVWGVPFLGEGLPTGEMLQGVKSAGGVAVLAHPSRKDAWTCVEPCWADRLLGIEVWNRKYDGWAPSKTAPGLLHNGGMIPFVGLDFHTRRQSFPLTMVLEIDTRVTEMTVLNCLKSGRAYPRALGLPLSRTLSGKALPVLSIAEQGRRTLATIARQAKGWAR